MTEYNSRFQFQNFISYIEVVCPKCNAKAVVSGGKSNVRVEEYEKEVRFKCSVCQYKIEYAKTPKFNTLTHVKKKRMLLLNLPVDPFFGFDLWYVLETPDGLLWAYNQEHFALIKKY